MIALLYLFLAGIAVGFGIATVVALIAVHEFERIVVRRSPMPAEPDPREVMLERLRGADSLLAFVIGPERVLGYKSCVEGRQ